MKRVLTAIPLIILLVATLEFFPPLVFSLLVLTVSALALEEFFQISQKTGLEVYRWPGHLLALLVVGTMHFFHADFRMLLLVLLVSVFMLILLGLTRGHALPGVLGGCSATTLGLIYIPFSLGLLILIRMAEYPQGPGKRWVFFGLLTTWCSDTAAFCAGKLWGRNKLASQISPQKTWEGTVGGLLGNLLAALLAWKWLLPLVSPGSLIALSFCLGAFGQLGDLAESTLKRGANMKDSSNLLPGHGGMLDRVDAVLFVAPVLFVYSLWFLK
jgi:phosphatidate cytidylyltransferase